MTVPSRFYPFNLTLNPGSTPGAPVSTQVALEDIFLRRVDVRIPPGPRGNVGFYILMAGSPIVPWGNPPQYIIGDNEPLSFDVNAEDNNGLTIVAFNNGAYAHTLYFRFFATPISLVGGTIPVMTVKPIE